MEQSKNLAKELTNTLCKSVLSIEALPSFERDLKRLEKKKADKSKLIEVIKDLANNKILAPKYKDHQLQGYLKEFRECHIENDWLLMYKKEKTQLILMLVRTGTHDDILR
jgi:mRNA interferase YafQ